MLVVAGTIDVEPDQRQAFLEGRRDAVGATLAEPGCLEYAFSADLLDPGRVRIFELWESAEDLDRHLGAIEVRPADSGVAPLRADLQRYEISRASPLRG